MRTEAARHSPRPLERDDRTYPNNLFKFRFVREEGGSSLVELALIFPVFILLLVGAAEFGRLAYDAIEVSNAANAGALFGAQSHATAADTTDMQQVAIDDAANISNLSATAQNSCTCSNGNVVTCANAASLCLSPNRIFEYVQVTTTATVNPIFHYPGLPSTFTLQGQSTLRVEQ
jgi:Flp pilus assembly protein TadG